MKEVLDEFRQRRRRLQTLRFGEDGRLVDLLTWLEKQPEIGPMLEKLRAEIDVTRLISPHGFRPKASSDDEIAAIGLHLLDCIKAGSDLLNSAMKRGIRPENSTNHGQDYVDEAMNCYINPFLDYLEVGLEARNKEVNNTGSELSMDQESKQTLAVFISHSSKDEKLAAALVELLRNALNIPASEIRCTSVNGYRLPIGAQTEEQLREEVHQAKAFIGLITPSSIASAYVMFELGARWGAKLHLAPLLGAGADSSYLRGPLSSLNALNCEDAAQVHQLIDDLARALDVQDRTQPAAYQRYVDELVKTSKENGATGKIPVSTVAAEPAEQYDLQQEEIKILKLFCDRNEHGLLEESIAKELNLHRLKANQRLERLTKSGYLYRGLRMGMPSTYRLTPKGRDYLINNNLI